MPERDLVARLQPRPPRTRRDLDRPAATDEARAVCAPVVKDSVTRFALDELDVRVAPRHGTILVGSLV